MIAMAGVFLIRVFEVKALPASLDRRSPAIQEACEALGLILRG